MAAQRLRRVLDLGQADAELNGGIAVLLLRALRHDLAVLHAQNGDRDMLAGVVVDAGHARLSVRLHLNASVQFPSEFPSGLSPEPAHVPSS